MIFIQKYKQCGIPLGASTMHFLKVLCRRRQIVDPLMDDQKMSKHIIFVYKWNEWCASSIRIVNQAFCELKCRKFPCNSGYPSFLLVITEMPSRWRFSITKNISMRLQVISITSQNQCSTHAVHLSKFQLRTSWWCNSRETSTT